MNVPVYSSTRSDILNNMYIVHRLNFDMPVHYPYLDSIKNDVKVVKQSFPPRRQGRVLIRGEMTRYPFYVVCSV